MQKRILLSFLNMKYISHGYNFNLLSGIHITLIKCNSGSRFLTLTGLHFILLNLPCKFPCCKSINFSASSYFYSENCMNTFLRSSVEDISDAMKYFSKYISSNVTKCYAIQMLNYVLVSVISFFFF